MKKLRQPQIHQCSCSCGWGLTLISNTPLNYRSQRAALCRQHEQREQNAFLQITNVPTSQSCCRQLLATAFQDEPKCHCSLSRNSNYGGSLLLLWQVLELLVNIEKQQHRWLQCSAFLGFLLKTQKSTTLWKKFVPFLNIAFHALNGFASQCSGQSCGTAEQKKKRKPRKQHVLTLGGKST